ncbi:MAG: hypothetical protein ACLR8Y_08465 [Alistipes indistinctus]
MNGITILPNFFDPFFDAPHHDESDEGDEGEGPEHGTPAVVDVLLEKPSGSPRNSAGGIRLRGRPAGI